ncbi:MAG: endonuclease/exonuclease/phosphatase family protein [Nitrospinae bacterium]|nr:endonuclease/exonuclease/phosphatase family protein [Nitrospinota bacterium]
MLFNETLHFHWRQTYYYRYTPFAMKILIWNIMHGGGRRADKIVERIGQGSPDIVILTEFRGTPPSREIASRIEELGLPHQLNTASDNHPSKNALLLASRWPLRRIHWRRPPEPAERRLLAHVRAPTPITIAAVHVPNRVSGIKYPFLDALRDLTRRRRGGDAIVAGDFNTGRIHEDETVKCFNRREDDFMTAMSDAGWADAYRSVHGRKRAYTWRAPGGGGSFRLDHAFVNRRAQDRLLDARIDWPPGNPRPPSDHAALWITLKD